MHVTMMDNTLRTLGYVFNQELHIWAKRGFTGINYSDGDETEQRITSVINQASDISVLSTELRQHCTDWASLYHLSGTRANVMRPFEHLLKGDVLEIGAGCGAITRYLGECGANVLALEGSPRRAAITRSRTRDLEKVTVLAENLDQFQCEHQFDVITLIGVLEYANVFTSSQNPPLTMLERVRSLLKPEGRLILAIENQLGLKYFAGAPEDHLGQPMVGIEGRYRKDQPQTFGRKVLAGMLEQAGFAAHEFLAPFPDYKLPVSILTEEGFSNKNFDAAAFAWQSARRDPQLPAYCNFSLELAWPEIFKNGLGLDVANSFLVISSPHAQYCNNTGILGYHYSVDRIPEYCKETVFLHSNSGSVRVEYRRLGKPNENTNKASNPLIRFIPPDSDGYVFGKPLSFEFISIVTKDGWSFEQVARVVRRYLSIVEAFVKSTGLQVNCGSPYAELPGEYFDAVPQNIIIGEDGRTSRIDKEWQLVGSIEVAHLLFRSLILLMNSVSRFGRPASGAILTRYQFVDGAFAAAGLKLQVGDYDRVSMREAEIQQRISGRAAKNFLTWAKDQPLPILNMTLAMAKRNGQNTSLSQAVAERDRKIADLQKVIASVRGGLSEESSAAGSDLSAAREVADQGVESVQAATASLPTNPRFKASIVIPVFNKIELTRQCLTTLAAVTTMPEYEVIVVDNASTDGTAEFLAALGGDVQVIRNQENYGFAIASNQGAKAARGEFLVFLNNDTIPTEGWLNALVDEVERHPEVAVVGSKLLYEDGTIQHAGVAFSRIVFTPYHIYRKFPADSPMVNRRREFQCVTAACMLVRRDVFEQVGRFDEAFKNGFEDVDLCLKIREHGWHIIYRPDSVVYHLESQTPGRKTYDTDNARRLLERWSHKWWIPDEDALYLSDGLACHVRTEQGMLYNQLESLTTADDRIAWQLVADTQSAAQSQDFARVKTLLSAIDRWPNDVWLLRWGALVCKCVDAPALALSFWNRVLAIEPDEDGYHALAKAALEEGRFEEAECRLAELRSCNPTHGGERLLSGILSMQCHRFAEAKTAFERAATYGADRRKVKLGLGMAAMGLADSVGAWDLFLDVATEHPDDAEALHWLLRAGTSLQRWEQLEPVVSQYVSRNPGDLSLRFALAGVFLRLNRWAAARQEYDSIRLLEPTFDGLSELASAIDENESVQTHHHAAR